MNKLRVVHPWNGNKTELEEFLGGVVGEDSAIADFDVADRDVGHVAAYTLATDENPTTVAAELYNAISGTLMIDGEVIEPPEDDEERAANEATYEAVQQHARPEDDDDGITLTPAGFAIAYTQMLGRAMELDTGPIETLLDSGEWNEDALALAASNWDSADVSAADAGLNAMIRIVESGTATRLLAHIEAEQTRIDEDNAARFYPGETALA